MKRIRNLWECVGLRLFSSSTRPALTQSRKTAMLFPGQGSQRPGMGKDIYEAFPAARHVFHEIDEALRLKLSKTMFEGTMEELSRTELTQPAILAHSIATLKVIEEEFGINAKECTYALGHSVGEYPALVATGALELSNAAALLHLRGKSMQEAAKKDFEKYREPMSMSALLCTPPAKKPTSNAEVIKNLQDLAYAVLEACERVSKPNAVVNVAGVNAPGQIVLSGHTSAIDAVVENLKEKGIVRRGMSIPVSAPFHSEIMTYASEYMAGVFAGTIESTVSLHRPNSTNADDSGKDGKQFLPIQQPCIPIVSNVTALPETDPVVISSLLLQGITTTVNWAPSVLNILLGSARTMNLVREPKKLEQEATAESTVPSNPLAQCSRFIEFGGNGTLTGLMRQMNLPEVDSPMTVSIGTLDDIKNFAKTLKV